MQSGVVAIRQGKKRAIPADEILQNASLAIDTTLALAPLIPIPVLSSIFAAVQVIVDAAKVRLITTTSDAYLRKCALSMHQKVREDRRAAAELAGHAANVMKAIHETVRGNGGKMDDVVKRALSDFES